MKILKTISIILYTLVVTSCIKKTSTPEEYLNQNRVLKKDYLKDISILRENVEFYIDSTGAARSPKSESKLLSLEIDTIVYGPKGKVAFLYISKYKNPYVIRNKDNIQFEGGCFIAIKDNKGNSIKLIDELKYSVTTSDISNKVSENLRIIYFREMNYIDGSYNINDMRFWESDVWK